MNPSQDPPALPREGIIRQLEQFSVEVLQAVLMVLKSRHNTKASE